MNIDLSYVPHAYQGTKTKPKTCSPKLCGSRYNRTTSGRPADQSTPLTNATMNPSNADASVNSVEAGIRGLCQRWRDGCKQHWRELSLLYPSVSQSVSCHVTSTPASERNHPPPEHSSSHASFRLFDGDGTLVKITRYRSFPACFEPNQRCLEGWKGRGLRLSGSFARFNDC